MRTPSLNWHVSFLKAGKEFQSYFILGFYTISYSANLTVKLLVVGRATGLDYREGFVIFLSLSKGMLG
jgi:hypothetical protein